MFMLLQEIQDHLLLLFLIKVFVSLSNRNICFHSNRNLYLVHFYSFSDGKCHSRKSSLFRRVTSAAYIPNQKSSAFVPLQHSRLVFYIPQEVRQINAENLLP
jgi:hypothetical protein